MTEELKNAAGAQEATPVAEAAKAETVKEAPATLRFVIGEKVGMTQLFDEKGNLHGVSVVKAGDCKVVRVRTQEKDGYNAVCVGFGEVKESKLNKPEMGYFKKANVIGQERIRIKLRSYDHRMLDASVSRIVETAQKTGAIVAGPVLLPVRIKKYTVLRSPHTDKKSREQFEMRIHKRLIDLKSPTSKTVDELMKLDLPAGVDVAIKSN